MFHVRDTHIMHTLWETHSYICYLDVTFLPPRVFKRTQNKLRNSADDDLDDSLQEAATFNLHTI